MRRKKLYSGIFWKYFCQISRRYVDNNIWIFKRIFRQKDIVYTNFDGKSLETGKKPSSEKFLHIGIYNLRPDINFILHVHSPYLSSFASSGRDLMEPIMAENVFYLEEFLWLNMHYHHQ